MQNLIMEALQLTLDNALKEGDSSPLQAKVANFDSLKRAQAVLGWNTLEFDATVATRTMPVFEKVARSLVMICYVNTIE